MTTEKKNFDIEKLAAIPTLYFPILSHNQEKMAFYWDKTGRMELYVMDLGSQEIEQISSGQIPKTLRAGYIWSRDDTKILFTKDFDGNEQHDIYSIDINTKITVQLTDTPEGQDYITDSSPDGQWLSFRSTRNGQQNLFRMSLDGEVVEQLTQHENPVWMGGSYSPDGRYLAYNCNEEGDLNNFDIYTVTNDGSEVKRCVQTSVGSQDNFAKWSSDSSFFVFTTDVNGYRQACTYHLDSEEIQFYGDATRDETAVGLTKDMKWLIAVVNENSTLSPILYNLKTKERREISFPIGSIDITSFFSGLQLLEDRFIIIGVNTPSMPSSLIKVDIVENKYETVLETDVGENDASKFVKDEFIRYPSLDATMIPAIVYKPRDFDSTKKYPGVIMPHGGPTGQYFRNFSIFAQFIADQGYVLMLPNVRGSTGVSVEFRDACRMDWGGKDHDDWVAGRQWLIDNASVDEDRIGVFGGSYGGYATLVCATKSPDLWRAACSWIPVSHLGNMYKLSKPHFQWFLRQQMGDPVQNKELWEERSPLNYIQNIKAPLLLVHGKNDPRCPVEESRNVRDKLIELGRSEGPDGDFQYIEFQDEGHGSSSDIKGRTRTLKLVGEFFNKHLR